jgi:hypothetical protein
MPIRLRRSLLQWLVDYGGGDRSAGLVAEEILEEFQRSRTGKRDGG